MEPMLIAPFLIGFFLTLFAVPIWVKKAKDAKLIGKDVHKIDKKEVAEAGGVPVLVGFICGILFYIALKTFYFNSANNLIETSALISVILIIGFIGLMDDILGWKIGLTKKVRIIFLIFGAIPLMVINAGESAMMGIELGLLYPLLFIPLGVVGASAAFNFIAGYNGLEASQGILILSALSLVTFFTGNTWLTIISLIMVFCLIAFYLFNKYPSKIFPGDILTYSIGALIASIAILGNIEKIAVFFFIPYIIETGLKLRGKLKKESFAKVNSNGLYLPYKKVYGLEHISIIILKKVRKKEEVNEKEVVYLINLFQIIVIALGLILFRNAIF